MRIFGNTTEEKFKSVETALNRIARKIKSGVTYAVPPIPVSFYQNDFTDSTIGRYIFPTSGRVENLIVKADFVDKPEKFSLTVGFFAEGVSEHREFQVVDGFTKFNISTVVSEGNRVELVLDPPESVQAVWIGFLYKIDPAKATKIYLEDGNEGSDE